MRQESLDYTNYSNITVKVHRDLKSLFKEYCDSIDIKPGEVLEKHMLDSVRAYKQTIRAEQEPLEEPKRDMIRIAV